MRGSPTLIDRILGQTESDDPNTRSIAFEKAREILKGEGVTLRDLHDAYRREKARETAKTASPTTSAPPPPPPTPPPPPPQAARTDATSRTGARPAGPKPSGRSPDFGTRRSEQPVVIHPRRVGLLTKTVDGKRVVRKKAPPAGAVGVLRILKDVAYVGNSGPRRRMTLSFETDDVLYEPFVETGGRQDWMAQIRRFSTTGERVVY